MRNVAKVLLPLLMFFTLVSCGEDKLQGVVTAKDVDAGYTFIYQMPTYTTVCSGNPSVCRQQQTGSIPIIYYVPTCYEITVKGDVSGDTCLDEDKWNAIQVGDDYEGADVDPKDRKQKQS